MVGAALLCRIGLQMWTRMHYKRRTHIRFLPSFPPTTCVAIRPFIFCFQLIFVCAHPRAFEGQLADIALWNKPLGLDDVRAQINNEQGRDVTGDIQHRLLLSQILWSQLGMMDRITPPATPECLACPLWNESYKVIVSDGRPADEAEVQGALTSYPRAWRWAVERGCAWCFWLPPWCRARWGCVSTPMSQ